MFADQQDTAYYSALQFYVLASDDRGLDNIEHVEIRFAYSQNWYTIHDTRASTPEEDQRDATDNGIFTSTNIYNTGDEAHRREMHDYQVRVTNAQGRSATTSFDLTVPEDWQDGHETFVYDLKYDGDENDIANGVEGLGAAKLDGFKIENNDLEFELTVDDARSLAVDVLLYNDDQLVGVVSRLTEENDYATGGQATKLDFDLSNEDDFEFSDNGLGVEDIDSYFVVHYGPWISIEERSEDNLNVQPFLYWSGWIDL